MAHDLEDVEKEVKELLSTLPKERDWDTIGDLVLYQGTWFSSLALKSIIAFQKKFIASEDDIVLSTFPKAGTTWTKALLYSIVNRGRFPDLGESPLQHMSPVTLVPIVDFEFFHCAGKIIGADAPRIMATHLPYAGLPSSIRASSCKIVYVYRNPMDLFTSFWQFFHHVKFRRNDGLQPESLPMDQCFEQFCNGVVNNGMYWDHVLEYWKASQEAPTKILLLNYEQMKEDPVGCVKKLADFLGRPFSSQEEQHGVVDHIVEFCSFQNLKNLEINLNGIHPGSEVANMPLSAFFRKGTVGDYTNYFTPPMVDRIVKITQEKWAGSGLSFQLPLKPQ